VPLKDPPDISAELTPESVKGIVVPAETLLVINVKVTTEPSFMLGEPEVNE
jgi:hypothetical protein